MNLKPFRTLTGGFSEERMDAIAALRAEHEREHDEYALMAGSITELQHSIVELTDAAKFHGILIREDADGTYSVGWEFTGEHYGDAIRRENLAEAVLDWVEIAKEERP